MAAIDVRGGMSFADQAAGARLSVTTREADPTTSMADEKAAAVREVAPGSPPDLDVVQDDGFRISGVTADGTIYYWRGYRSGSVAYDLVWRYPQERREQFDAPVERSVTTFDPVGTA